MGTGVCLCMFVQAYLRVCVSKNVQGCMHAFWELGTCVGVRPGLYFCGFIYTHICVSVRLFTWSTSVCMCVCVKISAYLCMLKFTHVL